MTTIEVIAAASLCAWVYLVFGRGGFWRIRETAAPLPATERSVAVVIPARNEEQVVARAVNSLIQQRYPGRLHVFLVDDHSTDATVAAAGAHDRLTILRAGALPRAGLESCGRSPKAWSARRSSSRIIFF